MIIEIIVQKLYWHPKVSYDKIVTFNKRVKMSFLDTGKYRSMSLHMQIEIMAQIPALTKNKFQNPY